MDRRTKATLHRERATQLLAEWGVAAAQARYSDDGHWYAALTKFPAALVDANGYVLFPTEQEYRASAHIRIGKQISVPKPGISSIPGYVRRTTEQAVVPLDLDIHVLSGVEGLLHLRLHLAKERDRSLVLKKKASVQSLACEVCGFSFARAYGPDAAEYCEVHHLRPLGAEPGPRRTSLKDLAVLCANCHRVVHLRNPPYTMEEVKRMRSGAQ